MPARCTLSKGIGKAHFLCAGSPRERAYTAQVLDADPDASPPWLVTAYVPGPSLQEAVSAHGPLPVDTALLLMAGGSDLLTPATPS
jgi:hypothetical protein